jgi:hypothetical protein
MAVRISRNKGRGRMKKGKEGRKKEDEERKKVK